jgi:hypothetical protein
MMKLKKATLRTIFVALCLITPFSSAAEPPTKVRVVAVVQKYEVAAMEDLYDDGRLVVYDAVTLNVVSPADLAAQMIRVIVPTESVADDAPLRKLGKRCRFDLDTALLKREQVFLGALENLRWIGATDATEWLRTPMATGKLTAAETSARGELLRLIDKSQDEEFRR